jgi:ABC-type oligopeptide transport system substrate-binding subunit
MRHLRVLQSRFLKTVVLVGTLLAGQVTGVSAEKVVQLPYFDNVPSFVPYYWQAQHILAQGTIFEGLFGYAPDPTGLGGVKVVPVIAESWTNSKDGLTWTIKLRKDKKWSNGDPITAKDFEWTYKYMCDPSIPDVPLWANHLQHVKNAWAVKAGGAPLDDLGVKATDDYTLVFTLASPRFDFNAWLVVAGSMPLHKATVLKYGPNEWWKPEHFVGNGPYVPQAWTPQKEVVLVKNKNYVGTVGNVDKIVLKNFANGVSQVQPYQAKELDLAWVGNVADDKYVNKVADLKASLHETPNDLFINAVQLARGFNTKIFDDKRIRQAFALSIDRETLVKTVLGGRAVASGAFWTTDSSIGKNLKPIGHDLAAAKKLLADAGYPEGRGFPALKFYITGTMPEVEFIVNQWKKNLGVDVSIVALEGGVYGSNYVWATWTPTADAGFTRITAPMNSFESGALDKNGSHVLWVYDFPADVRKKSYDLDQERINFLTKEGGTTDADWAPVLAARDKIIADGKAIVAKETNKLWLTELTRKPTYEDQFKEIYDNYKAAKTDKDKTGFWREANRLNLDNQKTQSDYNGMNETNRQARRLRYEILNSSFEKAIELAPKYIQVLQDQYYMIPIYTDKVQYLLRPNVTGLQVYKFSWGPAVFNLGYLNVK